MGFQKLRIGIDAQSFPTWILVAFLFISCLGMGSKEGDAGNMLTIEALYKHCNLPNDCSAQIDWEGETVTFWGLLDQDNIFHKRRYPKLPYEKFRLTDTNGRSVEVWAKSANNSIIFNKLLSRPAGKVTVTGRLEAVKLPISNKCKLGIKVVIDHADQIVFN